MGTAKRFIFTALKMGGLFIFLQCIFAFLLYFEAKDIVQTSYSELARLVASDNCLDDTVLYGGKTIYDKYLDNLEKVEQDTGYVEFDNNSLKVQYTSRDNAPQQYSYINTELTGYYVFKINVFGVQSYRVPIKYSLPIMGTKYYRDR